VTNQAAGVDKAVFSLQDKAARNKVVPCGPESRYQDDGDKDNTVFDAATPKPVSLPLGDAAELSVRCCAVPENVYGTAAMIGILKECDTYYEWYVMVGAAWCRLFISHVIQSMLIVGLLQLTLWQFQDLEDGNDCYKVQTWLFVVCHWLFFIHILKEIISAADFAELILVQMPEAAGSPTLRFVKEDDTLTLKDGGMSKSRKASIFIVVVLPRFIIAFALLVVGGFFLASARSNEDLFMNSLAAAFVIDIDEMVFEFLTPAYTQRLIAEMPPFESDSLSNSRAWLVLKDTWWIMKLFVSAALVYYFYDYMQHVENQCDDPFLGYEHTHVQELFSLR